MPMSLRLANAVFDE